MRRERTVFGDDPRIASLQYGCEGIERSTVDGYLPTYHVLGPGDAPGETVAPYAWRSIGRDIDRSPSVGTQSVTVELSLDDIDAGSDGEPSCAQVRAALAGM